MPSSRRVSPRPPAGRIWNSTANSRISISPSQKFGSEKPMIDPVMMPRPIGDRGASPAISPSGMPMPTARKSATTASSSVAGMRLTIRSTAGTPCTNERPRSPVSAALTNSQNCTHIGWSRPSRSIARSRSI